MARQFLRARGEVEAPFRVVDGALPDGFVLVAQ